MKKQKKTGAVPKSMKRNNLPNRKNLSLKPRLDCQLLDASWSDDGQQKFESWECRLAEDSRPNVTSHVALSTAQIPSHYFYDDDLKLIHPMESQRLDIHFTDDAKPKFSIDITSDEYDWFGGIYGDLEYYGDAVIFLEIPKPINVYKKWKNGANK